MALRRLNDFKFYEILNMLNGYFTPDSTDFFYYCVNTLDSHHHFLRSRFCKRDEPLKDFELSPDINRVLCVFSIPFDATNMRYKKDIFPYPVTVLKMQIVFTYESALQAERELCKELGFSYGYVLNTHTSEVTCLGYLK